VYLTDIIWLKYSGRRILLLRLPVFLHKAGLFFEKVFAKGKKCDIID
jgi:hypothetical protein